MSDTPKTPDTAPDTPTEAAQAAPSGAAAPAPQREPSVADTARLLAEHFPALFGAGVIKPIKLRIQADIHQRAPGVFTKKALSLFLQRHTTATAYLRALVAEDATRIDLDGQPVGEVAAEHRNAADVELARRRAIVEAKKLAGREAARASRHAARPPRPAAPPLPSPPAEASHSESQATGVRPAHRGAPPVQPTRSDRSGRSARPPHPGQAPRHSRPPHPGQQRGPGRPERTLGRGHEPDPANAPAMPLTPEQAAEADARHQRAVLLRSFEQSPLSKANFGALKGLSEAALDELLALARRERGSR